MKKHVLFILLSFLTQKTEAQVVFCPPGAEWHYKFNSSFGEINNEGVTYVRDSVIGTETFKVLLHNRFWKNQNLDGNPKLTLIKQKGDTVFFRNETTLHYWQILYNFATPVGQSWQNTISIFSSSPTTMTYNYTVTVTSVTNTTVNTFNLRRLGVQYASSMSAGIENVTITERFGCSKFLFNFYNKNWVADDEVFTGFLCYQDSEFGLTQFTDKPCNYKDYVGISGNNYQSTSIKIYPNPANDFFTISTGNELINGKSTVNIKDLCGREVKQVTIDNFNLETGSDASDASLRIDISDLANGVYILNLSNNNEIIHTGKLVKSD